MIVRDRLQCDLVSYRQHHENNVFIRLPSDIGTLVRATRVTRGLNQQELADKLGVSRWWVIEFEGGKPTARLDIVLRALAELEISLTASVDGEIGEPTDNRPPAPASPIDIDAIADTGLGSENAAATRKAKGRPR